MDAAISVFLLTATVIGALLLTLFVVLLVLMAVMFILDGIRFSRMKRNAKASFLNAYAKPPAKINARHTNQFFDGVEAYRNGMDSRR